MQISLSSNLDTVTTPLKTTLSNSFSFPIFGKSSKSSRKHISSNSLTTIKHHKINVDKINTNILSDTKEQTLSPLSSITTLNSDVITPVTQTVLNEGLTFTGYDPQINSEDLNIIQENKSLNLDSKDVHSGHHSNTKTKSQISYLQYSLVGCKSVNLVVNIHNCYKDPIDDNMYKVASDIITIPTILTGFTKTTIGLNFALTMDTWYRDSFESALSQIGYSLLHISIPKTLSFLSGTAKIPLISKILTPLLEPIGYTYTAIMLSHTAYYTIKHAYFSYCTHYAENEGECKANFYRPWFNIFEWLSRKTNISYFNTQKQEYQDIISSSEETNIISDTSPIDTCDNNPFSYAIEGDTDGTNIIGDTPA